MNGDTLHQRVVLITGPPCAGKTTLAHQLAQPEDTVLDFDAIARGLGSPVNWAHPPTYRHAAEAIMRALLDRLPGHTTPGTTYAIRSVPRAHTRAITARSIGAEQCILILPTQQQCTDRAVRDGRPDGTTRTIASWYAQHTPWSGDTIMRPEQEQDT